MKTNYKKRCVLTSLLFIVVVGCGSIVKSKPITRITEGVLFTKYQAFEVEPVTNETGKTFNFDVTDNLTRHIKSALEDLGYTVTNRPDLLQNVLVIKSSLIAFEPGSAFKRWLGAPIVPAGKTQATIKTSLIDKQNGDVIGDIVSAEAVSGGGLYTIGADKWIFEVIAKGVVNEIDKRMKER